MIKQVMDYVNDKEFALHFYKNRLNIVNYESVMVLEEKKISLKTELGILVINGNNLTVKRLLDQEILITGEFKSMEIDK